ncbi:unnamed protein product [Chironomus riparius]|uniref:Protein kinase domain-containing protein n=1 Tax=Chironomus riparius TaxID=315576 RepID=A0A9N9RLQ0_9DIPT|nr:unnamed protein product [Chironomus riparius]
MAIGKKFLAQLKSAFVDLEGYYTVMELVEAGDLFHFIARPNYRPNEELWSFISINLLMGLEQLHELGVIHNDLKPPNVLIHKNGYIVICDFGLSVISEHDSGTKGTPGYIAPENYTACADYFSLGVILYELSEKKRPFKDSRGFLSLKVMPAKNINEDVSIFIKSLLEVDPANGTCDIKKAKTFKCFNPSHFQLIENHSLKSPLLSYVARHAIIQDIERAFDFHPKSTPNHKDVGIQCTIDAQNVNNNLGNMATTSRQEVNIVELTMFACNDERCGCLKTFNSAKALQQHNRDLDSLALGKYRCDYCQKCFTRKERLDNHILSHNNPPKKAKK